jgi:hypothetical protein
MFSRFRGSVLAIAVVAGFAAPASAMPAGLDAGCQGVFARYQSAAGPKAFAAGRSGRCGWQRQIGDYNTPDKIRAKAIEQCTGNGGQNCRIVDTAK